ncbi:hypothetical protein [Streptomyces sp. NPDC048473]|uniref:hypothetical protein n=1 Tax=Streptomyces sp. NPDC048473 TaxID=3365556 RepID=UPI003717A72A
MNEEQREQQEGPAQAEQETAEPAAAATEEGDADATPGPDTSAEGPSGPRGHEKPPPPGDADADRPASVHHNNVNQFFYGALNAPQAHFGIGGAASPGGRRRATGWLDAGETDLLLESYVEPPCFDGAVTALQSDSVVVLVGPPGSGKRSGAVALLKEVAEGAEYVVLSPDLSLEQLAERAFERGVGYVLLDRMNEGSAGKADFDWRRVRDQVRGKGAHLVVTTIHEVEGAPPEAVRHVPWQAPDLAGALRLRLLKGGCAQSVVEEAVGLLPAGCRIAEVAVAAGRIAQGADPDSAWQGYGSSAARPVRDWFAGDHSLQEIAEVTTLAFATGAGRRAFESYQELLEPRLVPAFPQPPPAAPATSEASSDGMPEAAAVPRPVIDRRRSLMRNELVTTEEQTHDSLARAVVVFATPPYRQWVLEELWANHSTLYWNGVRDWLTELTLADPDPELQMSIASGLALLARPAFDEVADCYLYPWARGAAGHEGRSMATLVLWWMCLDETLGATALTLARGWAQSRDPGLRTTAMLAFSGQLGVRFPTDAVKWLWHLISQGSSSSEEAMVSMAGLVAVLTECREDAGVVLDVLVYRLRKQRRTVVATRLKEMTFDTVVAVLAVRDLRTGHPACAVLAERQPQLLGKLGELWAGTLCNRPRRSSALRALRDTLRALNSTCEKPPAVAEHLGRKVGAALPPDERPLLEAVLRPSSARAGDITAELTDIFLTAVLSMKD